MPTATWSATLLDCFDGLITLTDVTGQQRPSRTAPTEEGTLPTTLRCRGHTAAVRPILTIVGGVIAAVVVLWLVLLICFAILRPRGATLRDAVRIVPDAIRLVHRLARNRELDRGARCASTYFSATSPSRSISSPTSFPSLATPTTPS